MSSNSNEAQSRSIAPLLRRRRGQGLVEFALVLPFLLVLTLGIVDVGILIGDRYNVLYASREAARIGSSNACFRDDDSVLRVVAATLNKPAADIGSIYVYAADSTGHMGTLYQQYHIITATQQGFSYTVLTSNWPYTHRHNNINYLAGTQAGEWLGVRVNYTHHPITFVGQMFWGNNALGAEQTIMRIEPPEKADGTTDCIYP